MDFSKYTLIKVSFYSFKIAIDTVPTPAGINPSNRNSSSSPPQSTTLSEIFPFDDMPNDIDVTEFSCNYLGTTLPNNDDFEGTLIDVDSGFFPPVNDIIYDRPLEIEDEKLRIIAQPKPCYRGRYVTEVNKTKGRPNRFIRADQKDKKYIYPTIKVFIFMRCNKPEMTVVHHSFK